MTAHELKQAGQLQAQALTLLSTPKHLRNIRQVFHGSVDDSVKGTWYVQELTQEATEKVNALVETAHSWISAGISFKMESNYILVTHPASMQCIHIYFNDVLPGCMVSPCIKSTRFRATFIAQDDTRSRSNETFKTSHECYEAGCIVSFVTNQKAFEIWEEVWGYYEHDAPELLEHNLRALITPTSQTTY